VHIGCKTVQTSLREMETSADRGSRLSVILDDVIYVESRVMKGRVKKKRVKVERLGDEPLCSLFVGKVEYVLDPRACLVTEVEGKKFSQATHGFLYNSTSTVETELYTLELTSQSSENTWDGCGGTLRLCFESKTLFESWVGTLRSELYKGNSIYKILDGAAIDEGGEYSSKWDAFLHVNGISVYTEKGNGTQTGDSTTSGVMSSVVIRSTPKHCLRILLEQPKGRLDSSESGGGLLPFSDSLEVIRHVDAHSSVVRMRWSCSSNIMSYLLYPREAVMLRTWRKNDDGTYVVVYQSVDKLARNAEYRSPGFVAADAVMGFTIAPLREEYYKNTKLRSTSPESLVTLVIKADLGGVASTQGLLSTISSSIHKLLVVDLMTPIIMSLVLMRDRLEQSRFVVMPSMFSEEEEDVDVMDDRLLQDWIDVSGSSASMRFNRDDLFAEKNRSLPKKAIAPVCGQGGCTDKKFWSYPGYDYLRIRGASYLDDGVKIHASRPVFELYSSDLIDSQEVLHHIAMKLPSVQSCPAPYAFVLNLVFPNRPLQSLVTTWTCRVDPTQHSVDELLAMDFWEERNESLGAFFKTYKNWIEGEEPDDDERRNKKFKLIPRIAKGSWVIKQSVGTTPVLLGQKLATKYFRGRTASGCSYFEVDVDITSNPVANNVTRLVVNSITSLIVDLAPLVEGQAADELPERLIGSVRYAHLDLKTASSFDDATGELVRQ
jgi:hypothetical protein